MLHYHQSHEAAEALVKTIAAQGGTAMSFAADLSQEQETADLIPIIAKTIQEPIDCLVNNASIFERMMQQMQPANLGSFTCKLI